MSVSATAVMNVVPTARRAESEETWYAAASVAEDASVGTLTLSITEPSDRSTPTRAWKLLWLECRSTTAINPTTKTGQLGVLHKGPSKQTYRHLYFAQGHSSGPAIGFIGTVVSTALIGMPLDQWVQTMPWEIPTKSGDTALLTYSVVKTNDNQGTYMLHGLWVSRSTEYQA